LQELHIYWYMPSPPCKGRYRQDNGLGYPGVCPLPSCNPCNPCYSPYHPCYSPCHLYYSPCHSYFSPSPPAGAGTGKSTISAALCKKIFGKEGPVSAWHFLKYSDQRRLDPFKIVKSLDFQLADMCVHLALAFGMSCLYVTTLCMHCRLPAMYHYKPQIKIQLRSYS
jgi:hypothetical protein